jgi:hypothetical protein
MLFAMRTRLHRLPRRTATAGPEFTCCQVIRTSQALRLRMQTPYARRLHLPGPNLAAWAPRGYDARFVYMLTRHGTRYPTRKWLESFQQLEPLLQVRCRPASHYGRLACRLRLSHFAWGRPTVLQ